MARAEGPSFSYLPVSYRSLTESHGESSLPFGSINVLVPRLESPLARLIRLLIVHLVYTETELRDGVPIEHLEYVQHWTLCEGVQNGDSRITPSESQYGLTLTRPSSEVTV